MNLYSETIDQFYGQPRLAAKILTALREAGRDLKALSRQDLSPFDEYHGGGLAATRELATLAGVEKDTRLLDIGCGIGGPARTLAAEFGCRVLGIDLTEEFCRTGAVLTQLLDLAASVRFCRGNALELPFAEQTFQLVWTQGVLMNIQDKAGLFGEIYRVLKPGGRLAMQTELKGSGGDLLYPNYWAEDPSFSFFIPPQECKTLLLQQGFTERVWRDVSEQMKRSGSKRRAKRARAAVGFSVMAKSEDQERVWAENGRRNLHENRMVIVRAVFERPG